MAPEGIGSSVFSMFIVDHTNCTVAAVRSDYMLPDCFTVAVAVTG